MPALQIRPASAREEDIIRKLQEADDRSLSRHFGQRLGDLEYGEAPETAAENWLQTRRGELVQKICVEGNYCVFIKENRHRSTVDIIVAISDLLATAVGGIPVFTLATLLVRRGLDSFCECNG